MNVGGRFDMVALVVALSHLGSLHGVTLQYQHQYVCLSIGAEPRSSSGGEGRVGQYGAATSTLCKPGRDMWDAGAAGAGHSSIAT